MARSIEIPHIEKAVRLNPHNPNMAGLHPHNPNMAGLHWGLGTCHIFLGDVDQGTNDHHPSSRRDPRRRCGGVFAADRGGRGRYSPTFKAIKAELIDPTIATHNGRLVKTTGDGLFVEFGSVVDALRLATELQARMVGRSANLTGLQRWKHIHGIKFQLEHAHVP
jgi:hypothetical protein